MVPGGFIPDRHDDDPVHDLFGRRKTLLSRYRRENMTNNEMTPPLGDIKPRPFPLGESAQKTIDKIALAIVLYILLILYPSYGLLRWFWSGDLSPFDLKGVITALATALFLGFYSRRAITSRLQINTERE